MSIKSIKSIKIAKSIEKLSSNSKPHPALIFSLHPQNHPKGQENLQYLLDHSFLFFFVCLEVFLESFQKHFSCRSVSKTWVWVLQNHLQVFHQDHDQNQFDLLKY